MHMHLKMRNILKDISGNYNNSGGDWDLKYELSDAINVQKRNRGEPIW